MIKKINRVSDAKQISLLKNADIFNIHITTGDQQTDSNAISFEEALNIRATFPQIKLAVFFNNYSELIIAEKIQILKDLDADYYESAAPDFLKTEEFKTYLNELDKINFPKIVSGFFVANDDNNLLTENTIQVELLSHGIEFIEIDVDSLTDPAYRLTKNNLETLEQFCAGIPVLFSDSFSQLKIPGLKNAKGIYLNLKSKQHDIFNSPGFKPASYQNVTSTKTFDMTKVLKILRDQTTM